VVDWVQNVGVVVGVVVDVVVDVVGELVEKNHLVWEKMEKLDCFVGCHFDYVVIRPQHLAVVVVYQVDQVGRAEASQIKEDKIVDYEELETGMDIHLARNH
jgi:hypothetical protein